MSTSVACSTGDPASRNWLG